MSKVETAIRLVLEFNQAFNRHDVDGMLKLMSSDCLFEDTTPAPEGTLYTGREALKHYWQGFFQASPHAQIAIEDIFSGGLHCVMRWRYAWVDADGKAGYVRGVDLFKVKDDLICEKRSYVKG